MNTQVGLPRRRRQKMGVLLFFPVYVIGIGTLVSAVATQHLARYFDYQQALGRPLFGHIYVPWSWFLWAQHNRSVAPIHFAVVQSSVFGVCLLMIAAYFVFASFRSRRTKAIENLHGSSRWAKRKDIEQAGLLPPPRRFFWQKKKKGRGVYVGGWKDQRGKTHYLRHNGPEHVLAFAPTRSGKGVGLILPTLLSWDQSVVVYDEKGENFALTSGYRRSTGQKILVFDPADATGYASLFNPLQEIPIRTGEEVAEAMNLVQMVVDPDGKGLNDHWAKTSFMFLAGVVLYTIYSFEKQRPANLADVANTLSSDAGINVLYTKMKDNQYGPNGTNHPVIAKSAIDMMELDPRERSSVLSTAKTCFMLYADPVVAHNTSVSTFRLRDLMNHAKPVSLYIIVEPKNLERLRPIIRLLITQAVRILTPRLQFKHGQQVKAYRHQLLLLLDEFPELGRLSIFESSLATIAGYGLKAFLICQDLSQLKKAYGSFEAILAHCQIRAAYAPNTFDTAEQLSKLTGVTTIIKDDISNSGGRFITIFGHASKRKEEKQRALLTPDEVMRLPASKKTSNGPDGKIKEPGDMLVFAGSCFPIYGKQILYFSDPTLSARAKIAPPEKCDRLSA